MKTKTRALRLLSFISVFAACLSLNAFQNEGQDAVYLVEIGKNFPGNFSARFVTEDGGLAVTKQKPAMNLKQTKLDIKADEDLFLVELNNAHDDILAGEVYRYKNIAAVKLWKQDEEAHIHLGDFKNYVQRINFQTLEERPKPSKSKSSLSFAPRQLDLDISKKELKDHLEQFSGAKDIILAGQTSRIAERGSLANRELARAWLAAKYTELGFTVSEHRYRTGVNFIAEKAGKDPSKVFVISAHLDSVNNAGADDDGAGIISALAIAKTLQNADLKYTVRILGFDQEENGLVGSAAYARQLNTDGEIKKLVGVLNIEMTGYDADRDMAFHAIHCSENTSRELADAVLSTIEKSNLNLKPIQACTNRSDHASFWRYGVPAIVVSQNFFGPEEDSNPCYHLTCDKVDKINFDYMHELTLALALTVHSLAVNPTPK